MKSTNSVIDIVSPVFEYLHVLNTTVYLKYICKEGIHFWFHRQKKKGGEGHKR